MKATFIFMFVFVVALTATAQRKIEVNGRVVNEKGQAIVNARVTWVYEPEFQFVGGRAYESYLTSEDGYFGFVAEWKPKKRIRIFIEEPVANPNICVIGVLDFKNRKFDSVSHSQGLLISQYRREITFGDISNYIKYGTVLIDLADANKSFIEDIKNRLVYLQVRDTKGNLVSNETVNPSYSESSGMLKICLPEGKWQLEFDWKHKKVQLNPSLVTLSSGRTTQIKLEILEK